MNAYVTKAYLAELFGTFLLVFIGCGAAVFSGGSIGVVGVAFAFGLTLLMLAYAIGPISGCHINPAVTLGLLVAGKTKLRDAVGYWIAQVAGGIVAAFAVWAIAQGLPNGYTASTSGLAANGYGGHSPLGYSWASGFFVEAIMTFVLVLTVLFTTESASTSSFAGIAIGTALFLGNLVAIPLTNASINPARSIGPAFFVGGWALAQLWLFIVAPLLGGVAAAGLHKAYHKLAKAEKPQVSELEREVPVRTREAA
jgi:aquaporin Z